MIDLFDSWKMEIKNGENLLFSRIANNKITTVDKS